MKRALLLLCLPIAYAQPEADLATGKKLFQAHCAPCHGIDGAGGRGANLTLPKLRRAATSQAFFDIAKNGIEGTIMDGAWQLSDGELWKVVAYTQSLGKTAQVLLPGDPSQGKILYGRLGCAGCHVVAGEGRSLGPELTAIGARRSAAYLREAIVDPGATVPEEFVIVRAKSINGHEVRGMRVNEDSFTIQIRDLNNHFHSFRKTDLAALELEAGKSAMPAFGTKLAPNDLDNLVAYLASLRGEP